jgi:hypothetical protein
MQSGYTSLKVNMQGKVLQGKAGSIDQHCFSGYKPGVPEIQVSRFHVLDRVYAAAI